MQIKQLLPLAAATLFMLAACNENKDAGSNTAKEADSAKTKTTPSQGNASEVRSNITVAITGGDMNGTYTAVCRDACCSWGIAGDKVFGNQYSETGKGTKELSSVQLIVDDVTGDKSTGEFTLTVGFGELFGKDSKTFNIDTRNGHKKGSGTLDLQYSGEKAVVSIKGTSAEGPAIDLKMECNKVMNPNNLLSQ